MNQGKKSLAENGFILTLSLYNILFLTYIFVLGYYNRLSGDDFAFMGHMREHGFLSPFTYWYDAWQGRFCPQFVVNTVLSIYKVIPNLMFYTVGISVLFILSIYKILKICFPLSKLYLLNFSTLIFSTLVFTSLEFNTFYWITVSPMYFGGILFALFGMGYILQPQHKKLHYWLIALSFIYVGSSSEHVGILASAALGLLLFLNSIRVRFNIKKALKNKQNIKLLIALTFCAISFIITILAPGNKVRMGAANQTTDIMGIYYITKVAFWYMLRHALYKLPYFVAIIPPLLLLGALIKEKVKLPKVNYFLVLLGAPALLLVIIFLSNAPSAYAISAIGPTRSYVFISFLIILFTVVVLIYTGYRFLKPYKWFYGLSIFSSLFLIVMLVYVSKNEIPEVIKYSKSADERVEHLLSVKNTNPNDTIFVEPLYQPSYITIQEIMRLQTNTYNKACDMSNSPYYILEIGEKDQMDWTNNHLKHGLGIEAYVALTYNFKINDEQITDFKQKATNSYETDKIKCYVYEQSILYQIDTTMLNTTPANIYLRIAPKNKNLLTGLPQNELIQDFNVNKHQCVYTGNEFKNQLFVMKTISKYPFEELRTGFYELQNDEVVFTNEVNVVMDSK